MASDPARHVDRLTPARSDSGQTLTLFALVLPVLLGLLSLAMEIGFVYFERRHLQTVADTAALVGAQRWVGNTLTGSISSQGVAEARAYATKNLLPFEQDAAITVNLPPASGQYAGNSAYIEVSIANTPTLSVLSAFRAALGQSGPAFSVPARAVARGAREPLDAAIIALDPGNDVLVKSGGGTTTVNGSIYSWGETKNTNGNLTVTGWAMSRGGFQGQITAQGMNDHPGPLYDPNYTPAPVGLANGGNVNVGGDCSHPGLQDLQPGTYSSIKVGACGTVRLSPGVYYLTGAQGVQVNSGGSLIGLGPVQLALLNSNAEFTTQAGATITLTGSQDYNNVVIWSAGTSQNAVKLTGSSTTSIAGSVYVPHGTATIAGGANAGVINGQLIAWAVILTGGGASAVTYNPDLAPGWPEPVLRE